MLRLRSLNKHSREMLRFDMEKVSKYVPGGGLKCILSEFQLTQVYAFGNPNCVKANFT